jgi:putative flavoprotein involved in K+ transport
VLARIDDVAGSAPGTDVEPVAAPAAPAWLDLQRAGVTAVVWATGYRRAYPWLHVPVLDAQGEIVQRRGVTPVPGLYAVGLRLQWRRSSHFLGGVGEDAAYLAERIAAPPVALAA